MRNWECRNDPNIEYVLEDNGDGQALRHLSSVVLSLSVDCNSTDPSQRFKLDFVDNGEVKLVNRNTCLYTNPSHGADVLDPDCSEDFNFSFVLDPERAPKVVTLGDSYSSGTGLYPSLRQPI